MIIIVIIITILDLWEAWGRTWWHSRGRLTPVFPPQPGKTFGIIIVWIFSCCIFIVTWWHRWNHLSSGFSWKLSITSSSHRVCALHGRVHKGRRGFRKGDISLLKYHCWGDFPVISFFFNIFVVITLLYCLRCHIWWGLLADRYGLPIRDYWQTVRSANKILLADC